MDDLLIISNNQQQAQQDLQQVINILTEAGFLINWNKSELQAKTQAQFLGVMIDTTSLTVSLPQPKIQKCLEEINKALDLKQQPISVRLIARIIGIINSFHLVIPELRLYTAHLQQLKATTIQQRGWNALTTLTQPAREDLLFWKQHLQLMATKGTTWYLGQPDVVIESDSSDYAWGAHIQDMTTGIHRINTIQQRWQGNERNLHINDKELQAIINSVSWGIQHSNWNNIMIQVKTDNKVALAYVNHIGGRILHLNDRLKPLHHLCQQHSIKVQAVYIKGEDNLKADHLSRIIESDYSEWRLHPNVFRHIDQIFGPHHLDLFATLYNSQLHHYCSYRFDRQAMIIDCFNMEWKSHMHLYAFPPPIMIPKLLNKMNFDQAELTLITPAWTTATWWPLLIRHVVDMPIVLWHHPKLLLPPTNQPTLYKGPSWTTVAWRLSTDIYKLRAFQKTLESFFLAPFNNHQQNPMNINGEALPNSSMPPNRIIKAITSSLLSRTL